MDSALLGDTILLVVIATTIWMIADAAAHRIPSSGDDYNIHTGALSWFLCALLMWIVAFPYYLVRRSVVLRKRNSDAHVGTVPPPFYTGQPIGSPFPDITQSADQLRVLKDLLDGGIISQEDFDTKKKQLLDL